MSQDPTGHFPDEGQTEFETDVESGRSSTEASPDTPADPNDPVEGERPDGAEAADADSPESDAEVRVAELTLDLKRLQAEYVNYKRRVDRDRELVLQNAKYSILSALLPLLDDVDRARDHGELNGGFKAVAEALERVVQGEGLIKFGTPGEEFDPRIHEALMHSLSPEVETTTCDKVVQAGYQFGARVVRPALVTVVDPDPDPDLLPGPARADAPDTGTSADTGARES